MDDDQILTARYHARDAAESLIAAYWSDQSRKHLVNRAVASVRKAAEVFGFDLVAKGDPFTDMPSDCNPPEAEGNA